MHKVHPALIALTTFSDVMSLVSDAALVCLWILP